MLHFSCQLDSIFWGFILYIMCITCQQLQCWQREPQKILGTWNRSHTINKQTWFSAEERASTFNISSPLVHVTIHVTWCHNTRDVTSLLDLSMRAKLFSQMQITNTSTIDDLIVVFDVNKAKNYYYFVLLLFCFIKITQETPQIQEKKIWLTREAKNIDTSRIFV